MFDREKCRQPEIQSKTRTVALGSLSVIYTGKCRQPKSQSFIRTVALGSPLQTNFYPKKSVTNPFSSQKPRMVALGSPLQLPTNHTCVRPTTLTSDQPHLKKIVLPQTLPTRLSFHPKHSRQTPTRARPSIPPISTPASRRQPIFQSKTRHERSWVIPPKTRAKNKK